MMVRMIMRIIVWWLILSHSTRLSAHIMAPVVREGNPINPALLHEWMNGLLVNTN